MNKRLDDGSALSMVWYDVVWYEGEVLCILHLVFRYSIGVEWG